MVVFEMDDLKRTTVLDLTTSFDDIGADDEFYFDFARMKIAEPFAMLVFTSKFRKLMAKYPDAKFYVTNWQGKTYPAHMGFFKSMGVDFGNEPGEARGSRSYIPITCLNISELYRESLQYHELLGETIERQSGTMATLLTQRKSGALVDHLSYAFKELMRNVVDHSEARQIWLAGQYWPSLDKVELAILDEGVGIRRALRHNPHLSIDDDEDAILLACEPGISGKAYKGRPQSEDPWENSGFGLYVLRSICHLGGTLTMLSGASAIVMARGSYSPYSANFQGTAIGVTLYLNRLEDAVKLLPRLVAEGERRAGLNSGPAVLRASKVTSMVRSSGLL